LKERAAIVTTLLDFVWAKVAAQNILHVADKRLAALNRASADLCSGQLELGSRIVAAVLAILTGGRATGAGFSQSATSHLKFLNIWI
jgi:hypothetical protein